MAKRKCLCWICGKYPTENEYGICQNCQMCVGLAMFNPKHALGVAAAFAAMATYEKTPGNHAAKSLAANAKLKEALTCPPEQVIV